MSDVSNLLLKRQEDFGPHSVLVKYSELSLGVADIAFKCCSVLNDAVLLPVAGEGENNSTWYVSVLDILFGRPLRDGLGPTNRCESGILQIFIFCAIPNLQTDEGWPSHLNLTTNKCRQFTPSGLGLLQYYRKFKDSDSEIGIWDCRPWFYFSRRE